MPDNNNIYPNCSYPHFTPRTSYDKGCRCVRCKNCRKQYSKERWKNVLKKKYHQENKFYRDKAKKYRNKNLNKVREYHRLYAQKQRLLNPLTKIKENLRTRLNKFIKKENKSKQLKNILGCSYENLKIYLENKFYGEMTWENYGKLWCIDHIIPLASAKTTEEVENLNHYTNLQPLLNEDNLKKGKKLI